MIKALLEKQKILNEHIIKERNVQGDKLEELFLSTLIEISECLNEWNLFKFWKKNPEPVVSAYRKVVTSKLGIGAYHHVLYNPMLEEYVDGLKFMLCIANKIDFDFEQVAVPKTSVKKGDYKTILRVFGWMYGAISNYKDNLFIYTWESIVSEYLRLGHLLGFSNEEIIQMFDSKTEINYERVTDGY